MCLKCAARARVLSCCPPRACACAQRHRHTHVTATPTFSRHGLCSNSFVFAHAHFPISVGAPSKIECAFASLSTFATPHNNKARARFLRPPPKSSHHVVCTRALLGFLAPLFLLIDAHTHTLAKGRAAPWLFCALSRRIAHGLCVHAAHKHTQKHRRAFVMMLPPFFPTRDVLPSLAFATTKKVDRW